MPTLTDASIMLSQAQFALRCYTNPEPIEVVAARCGVSVGAVLETRRRQRAEAAKMGRTIPLLQAQVNYWQKQCQP